MNKGFWAKIKTPCAVLAPMADVTDPAFRRVIAKYGKPDVTWTEFVSADGLCSAGRPNLIKDLVYDESERPIVAQLFSSNPEKMKEAAKLCQDLGFDGIDINMGCPDRSIEKQGSGAAMIKNPKRAREIIRAAKEGAPNLPISVKTRIGYNKNEIATWIPEILAEDVVALTVHCRTRKEMSLVPARWEHLDEVVAIRNSMGKDTLILGNGDIKNVKEGKEKALEHGADGAMLGRAIFGNPWLFSDKDRQQTLKEKLEVLVEHTKLFGKLCDHKSFAVMKKHYKAYVNGFDGAKDLRIRLMETNNAEEVEQIVGEFIKTL